jgi:hypothetical protein
MWHCQVPALNITDEEVCAQGIQVGHGAPFQGQRPSKSVFLKVHADVQELTMGVETRVGVGIYFVARSTGTLQ